MRKKQDHEALSAIGAALATLGAGTDRTKPAPQGAHPLAHSIADACLTAGICRANFYGLLRTGLGPPTFKIGRRRLVRHDALVEWLRERETESLQSDARVSDADRQAERCPQPLGLSASGCGTMIPAVLLGDDAPLPEGEAFDRAATAGFEPWFHDGDSRSCEPAKG